VAERLGQPAQLAQATDAFNETIVPRLTSHVRANVPARARVTVLGLSYKPSSNVVEASQGVQIAAALVKEGYRVAVYDPLANEQARQILGECTNVADSLEAAVADADLILIANPDHRFDAVSHLTAMAGTDPVVLDAWRILRESGSMLSRYHPFGVGRASEGCPRGACVGASVPEPSLTDFASVRE
jgi:UDPglucose 6-dehydrogenase